MAKWELLIFVAFAALVCCNEVEDVEQKKRGAGKGTSLNAIPTGAQKQDYTYSIYNQNPSQQTSSSPQYQSQVHSSFYPSQASSQYYSSPSTQGDSSSSYAPQQQQQQQPPQINLLPPPTTSQFVPLNFVPNPGYQSKYQLVPSKSTGNIQLAFLQQPTYPTQPIVPYAPQLFAPSQANQVNSHQSPYNPLPQGHFNVAPNYQPLSLGGSYLNHPSTMLLFAHPNPGPYNNLLYQNPVQSFYNYYPTNSQSKYNVQYVQQGSGQEYEKLQGPVSQSIPKEENDISHSSEYTAPSDSNSSYKNAYTASRSTYAKL
ncbi:drebrin-like protein [Trichoplusia ni]|uniref:Drebrin-like protein n=1 Tax=Trichoplusia ni TaxID=7111 RepID=A0A7E5VQV8_TRINI|nr:drebrin-like protein [Trichoplusia ni]